MIDWNRTAVFSGERCDPPPSSGEVTEPDEALGHAGRILVVEDDYLVGLSSEWALSDAGFEVLAVVATGEDALEHAAQDRPDLVLMDIRLAGRLDGVETAVALRADSIRCLFASANSDPGTMARAEAADPLGWLRKPYSDAALVEIVRAAMTRLPGN